MEDMRAVYRLNEEKLEFNHKVLHDREEVNKGTLNSLKSKERRIKGTKSTVKAKFEAQSKYYEEKNKSYTKDYKRFTKEYLLL
jgi:dynein regulatory complex protein 1